MLNCLANLFTFTEITNETPAHRYVVKRKYPNVKGTGAAGLVAPTDLDRRNTMGAVEAAASEACSRPAKRSDLRSMPGQPTRRKGSVCADLVVLGL